MQMRRKHIQEKHIEQLSQLFLLTRSSSPYAAQNLSPPTPTGTHMDPHPSHPALASLPITFQAMHHPSSPRDGDCWTPRAINSSGCGQEGSS